MQLKNLKSVLASNEPDYIPGKEDWVSSTGQFSSASRYDI